MNTDITDFGNVAPSLLSNPQITLYGNNGTRKILYNRATLGIGAEPEGGVDSNIIENSSSVNALLSMSDVLDGTRIDNANITVDKFGRITAISQAPIDDTTWILIGDSGASVTISNTEVVTLSDPNSDLLTETNPTIGPLQTVEIDLQNIDTVTPGPYQVANITVDAKGRITLVAGGPQSAMTFNLDGDTGPTQLVEDGNTLSIIGGNVDFVVSRPVAPGPFLIDLIDQAGITEGTYLSANVTVNNKGIITAISQGASFTATFDLDGDSGPTQTISNGDTMVLKGQLGEITVLGFDGEPKTLGVSVNNIPFVEGDYTNGANVTVDSKGRITTVTQGNAGNMSNWTLGDGALTVLIQDSDLVTIDGKNGLRGNLNINDIAIKLINTTVTAGTYTNVDLTVDQRGRITAASDGTTPGLMSSWNAECDSGPTLNIIDAEEVNFVGTADLTTTRPQARRVFLNLVDQSIPDTPFTSADITVDQQGIITAINKGDRFYNFFVDADEGNIQSIINDDTLKLIGTPSLSTVVTGLTATINLPVVQVGATTTKSTITVDDFGKITANATGSGGNMTNWIMNSTAGPTPQTIANGDTVIFKGVSFPNVIDVNVSSADTLTLDLPTLIPDPPDPIQYPTIVVNTDGLIAAMVETPDIGSMDNWVMNTNGGLAPQTIEQGNTVLFVAGTGLELTTVGGNNWGLRLPTQGGLAAGDYTDAFLTVNDRGVITAIASGLTSFNIEDADGNVGDVTDGDTLTLHGNGSDIETAVTATDTITVSLADKGVAGSYNVADINVNGQGLITAIVTSTPVGMINWVIQANGADDQTITNGDTFALLGGDDLEVQIVDAGTVFTAIGFEDKGFSDSGIFDITVNERGVITALGDTTPQVSGGSHLDLQYHAIDGEGVAQFGGTSDFTDTVLFLGIEGGILYDQSEKPPLVADNQYIGNKLTDFTSIDSSSADFRMTATVLSGSGVPGNAKNRSFGALLARYTIATGDDVPCGAPVFLINNPAGGNEITILSQSDLDSLTDATLPTIIGIAQESGSAGETIDVCIRGLTTTFYNGLSSPVLAAPGSAFYAVPVDDPTDPNDGTMWGGAPGGVGAVGAALAWPTDRIPIVGYSATMQQIAAASPYDNTFLVDVNPGLVQNF